MRILMLCGMIMLSAVAQARPNQEVPKFDAQVPTYYQITQKEIAYQGKQYRLFLAIPKNTIKTTLIYGVDGNAQFPLMVNEAIKQRNSPLPAIISVGYVGDKAYFITERMHDYTPSVKGEAFSRGGNAENFYHFILTQVRPYAFEQLAQENISVTQQSLFGHSFGGVFTLYVLFNHPETFQRYIAASPSLWWGNGEWVKKEQWQAISGDTSIAITLGEKEENPDLSRLSEEQQKNYQERSSWLTQRQLCQYLSDTGKQCEFYLFEGKSHGGSIPDAINIALEQSAE
ncbi:alpha/beta hydrolase [Proteus sp. FME41]|uniref:alpha/beta hydrolase n=1 Tax=Proteus sp. FME41 TaxID=2742608 RepID=UPI001D004D0D|nr:alpha/beta hydrolase-fold protein [Proteus sp. FME41]